MIEDKRFRLIDYLAGVSTIEISAHCPECGNYTWIRTKSNEFECGACGDIINPEDMASDDDGV